MVHGFTEGQPSRLEFEGVDELTGEVFQAFRRAIHLQRQLVLKTLAAKGGHHGEAFCLRALAENDGLSQRDLATMLHLSRPRVTKLLQAMETAGTIERRTDERDRRLTRVFVTEEGRRRERELHAGWADHVNQTIGVLSESDRRELGRLLNEISDHTARILGDTEAATAAAVGAHAPAAVPPVPAAPPKTAAPPHSRTPHAARAPRGPGAPASGTSRRPAR